ncbi:MAG: permease-like cell division protein FtsX [Actinomycetota bacterium]|jgi:cell division transport system permease protein|nr:permease-like cell division protein FtsX [Actinomycetota bacterium]MDA2982877.1 permease-like cell division protein FtsX [Actinomycetota bacterium]MDA3041572.1 permease-like cell division protein FtsX [Actinomycetota bacterium]
MFSRIAYAFRETWESFRRNITLTAAAVLTSAVSLLLVGATFLIQRAFENLLVQWRGDVEMIIFVRSDASAEQIALVDSVLRASPTIIDVEKLRYLNKTESYEEAKRIFVGDPVTLSLLAPETIPTQFKVVPLSDDPTLVRSLSDQYRTLPGVEAVALAEDEFEVISTLSNFIRVVTLITSLVLLLVAVGLIWNTIRTAMFARRREIEVMKLVGATNWFIRVPFMLEGLLQGLIGGVVSCGGLWLLNSAWTNGVTGFKPGTGISSLVVPDSYLTSVMFILLAIGALVGAVGSAIAATRFLDV